MKRSWKRLFAVILTAAMALSLLPATALAAPRKSVSRTGGVTIDVSDYGADPTGTKESSTAVIAALEYAATLGEDVEKTIYFPEGEYHFYADYSERRELYVSNTVGTNQNYKNKRLGILVEDLANVTVDGGGSQFIFHGDMTALAAIRSQNVTFTNFSMDWASPSVIDVTVESRVEGENAAIVYIPPCYTYEINGTNIHWTVEGDPTHSGNNELRNDMKQIHDLSDGTTVRDSDRHVFSNVSSFEKLADNRLKITYSNAASVPAAGLCFQLRNTTRTTPGIFFWESENITMSDAHVQFLHGFGMVGQLCKNITLNGVKFAPRAGTGRTTAGFADFVQMSSVGGKVTITDCEFSGPHDDPINIHGTFLVVKEISSDRRTVTVQYIHGETAGFPQYYVGDTVDFSTKGTIIPIDNSTRTVKAVENFPNGDRTRIKVTLDAPIPSEIAVDGHVLENVTYIPEVQIDGCRFVSTPTSGILVTTRKAVVIENNFFDRMGMQSIYISCDAQSWYESGRAEDVTIRNNTFIVNPRYGGDRGELAAIGVRPTNRTHDPDRQIHRNIKLENNTFLMARDGVYAVNAKSVNTLTVKNNKFLRYTPNAELTLTAENTDLAVGGTQASTLSATGLRYTNRLFRLEACKNVVFENNAYDDGLNLGVALESITTAADVNDRDGVLTVGGSNQLPGVGAVSYFSSDPTVVTVSESGVVTGVGPGDAEIYAYRTVAGRTFESNHLTFHVTGEAVTPPSVIEIAGGADAVEVGVASAPFTATVSPSTAGGVVWAVKPFTDGAAAAIDQSGVLTATAPGVVEVTASKGGVTASKLVTVKKPTGGLGDAWTVDRGVENTWSTDAQNNTVTITAQVGGDWGSNQGGHNFFLTDAPEGDFEITVKLNNKTCGQQGCYCEAGITVYKDANNYVSVVRKNNGGTDNKLSVNSENGGTASEAPLASDVSNAEIYLKLKKSGNNYTGSYSTDGTTWTAIRTAENALNNYKIGFFATNKKGDSSANHDFTFEQFAIGGEEVALIDNNAAPSAGMATLSRHEEVGTVTANYSYSDTDGDAESGTLFAWYVADTGPGHFTRIEGANTDTLTVTAATSEKWVKAVVIPRDATGRYGAPVTSGEVQAPAQKAVDNDATLSSLSVEGFALTPAFDPAVTKYTVNLPSGVSRVTVKATATQKTATVTGTGEVIPTGATATVNVCVFAPDNRTNKTYTITINSARSSDATLTNLTAAADSAAIVFHPATLSYQLVAEQSAENLTFAATPADGATVEVRFNGEEMGEVTGEQSYPLAAGLNNLELRVTAADGVSSTLYRVSVLKSASTDTTLSSLTVNGGTNLLPMTDHEAMARVDGSTATIAAAATDPNASVLISVNGKRVTGDVPLTKAVTYATIRVVAEDTVTSEAYTLVIVKNDPSSAELYKLDLGKVALSPAFDANVIEYTAVNYGNATTTLRAVAAQAGAKITYETVDDYAVTELDSVSTPCNYYKGEGLTEEDGKVYNTVIVTVTSPDRTATKTYTVKVEVVEEVWLSDLVWLSSSYTGWGSIGKDIEVSGGTQKMQLLGPNSAAVTFDKGLGTHANSEIFYDLSSMGFTAFTAKVGMDYSQNNTTQRLRFDVLTDGTNQFTQTDMGRNTPYAAASVTIPADTAKLTLKATFTTANDANAHADWAEAKLSSTLDDIADQTDILIKYLELEEDAYTVYANTDHLNHTVALHPVVKPIGAALSGHQRVLEWSSRDTEVATVAHGDLHEGIITGQSVGETTVTVKNPSQTLSASCEVTVKWKLAGKVSVSGGPKVGAKLTGALNQLDVGAKDHVDIQWWRKGKDETEFTAISGATAKEYTVAETAANVGAEYKVVVTGTGLYDGDSESDPITMTKLDGLPLKAAPKASNASTAAADNGAITGLFKGRVYQYQKVAELDEQPGEPTESAWKEFYDDSANETDLEGNYGTAVISGLTTGTYVVRRAADDLHEAGPHLTVTIDVVGSQKFHVTNPNDFDGNIVQVGRTEITEGDAVTLTVTPKEGYELVPDSLKATEDEGGLTHIAEKKAGTANQYTFTMPAAAVTISAQFRKKTYTITHDLTNITCDMDQHDHTVTHGEDFSITLTPDEGYEIKPTAVTVTNTDTNKPFNDYSYSVDESDPEARVVLTFEHGVTCNLTVSGKAVRKTYPVDYSGLVGGLRAPNAPQNATHGVEFAVTLTAAQGYALPETVAVTVGGVEVEATYEQTNGKVTIPGEYVTGPVAIAAAGVAQDVSLQTATLVGPARVGRILTVNTVPVNAQVTYQWCYVDDGVETPIENATNARYSLTGKDEGKMLCVKVKAVENSGYAGELTSAPTAAILPEAEPFVFVETVTLDETAAVAAGKTLHLTAVVTPENPTSGVLFWSSDNEAVATVDQNGTVKGVAEGVVTITAAATDHLGAAYDTCTVTVTKAETPSSRPSSGNNTSTTTETRDDGSKVTTVTKPDGTVTETVQQPDGIKSETVTTKNGDVTITVTDENGEELVKAEIPAAIPEPETKFEDVDATPWAEEAIQKMAGLELFNGTGGNKYSPVAPMTRGSLATVLHRLSQGKTDYETTFKDVAGDKYYTEGVAWAAQTGVVTGYTEEIFAPDDVITREQLAVMLARYAKLIGMDTKADSKALDQFADGENTGSWAVDGVAWCVANGILKGKGQNNLDPTANVTRAEVAVMLDRFIALLK